MNFITKYWILICIVFFLCSMINVSVGGLIIGSIFLYTGMQSIRVLLRIGNKGIKCMGRILSYETGRKGYKTPVIEYNPERGEVVKEKPFIYSSANISKVRTYRNMIDREVLVLYDPEDPKKFVIADEQSFNYVVFSIISLFGLGFIIINIFALTGHIKIG